MNSSHLKKILILLVFFLSSTVAAIAQAYITKDPLDPSAFTKMIVQDITYAIVGENTPVNGLKVDVSKPEGTISGMYPTKNKRLPWDIFGFELKGGVTDRNFSFLKGFSSANTAFEFRPSFHIITRYNSAKYGKPSVAEPKKKIVHAKNMLVVDNAKKLIDTMFVMTVLFNHHFENLNNTKPLPFEVTTVTLDHRTIAAYFIPKILNNPSLKIDTTQTWISIISNLPQITEDANHAIMKNTYYNTVETLFRKYQKLYDKLEDDTLDKMINNASEIWTRKKYVWWTLSPYVRTEKVNEFYTRYEDRDSSYFKSDYRWYYGLTGYLNGYWVTPKKVVILLRGGISVSHNNNLSTLSSYNYQTNSPFFQYGSTVTEKTKTGSAYNHADMKTGLEKQLSADLYILPLVSLVPGIYLSANVSHSALYNLPAIVDRASDEIKAGAEGGLVFNVNNRDKDKTLLSILTYFRYEDLTDKRRTSTQTKIQESREDLQKRNISIGIRVGIPIVLPKEGN